MIWSFKDNIWNGTFGLKSQFGDLFGVSQFPREMIIDQRTGKVISDPDHDPVNSYGTRLKDVWVRAKKADQVDIKPDSGFYPKASQRSSYRMALWTPWPNRDLVYWCRSAGRHHR